MVLQFVGLLVTNVISHLVPISEEGDDEHDDEEGEEGPHDVTGVARCRALIFAAVVHADQSLVGSVCVVVMAIVIVI